MILRPFNFFTGVSLMLVLLLAALCGWSYHRTDVVGYVNSISDKDKGKCTEICLASTRGQLSLLTVIDSAPALVAPAGKFGWQAVEPQQAHASFGMAGFSMTREWVTSDRSGVVSVGAPYWFLILCAALLPTWWSHRRRRKAAKR
jgi:hypothetical protein